MCSGRHRCPCSAVSNSTPWWPGSGPSCWVQPRTSFWVLHTTLSYSVLLLFLVRSLGLISRVWGSLIFICMTLVASCSINLILSLYFIQGFAFITLCFCLFVCFRFWFRLFLISKSECWKVKNIAFRTSLSGKELI